MSGSSRPLHIRTALLESTVFSQLAGCKVYLKLECNQPGGSFKIRGIGHSIQKAIERGCDRLVASSGGNAGFAAAYAARKLNVPIRVIVPESTALFARKRLEAEGATVIVHGAVWDNADEKAQEEGKQPGCAYIAPFDHPDVWAGNSSVIHEIKEDLPDAPGLVVVAVGGGGLLCGLAQGMEEVGWGKVPILAMETRGADSYNQAVAAGKLVTLPDITSVAKRLGALTVCQRSLDYYNSRPIISKVIEDKDSISAALRILDDHRLLVEPACSTAVAPVYMGIIQQMLAEKTLSPDKAVVILVCGGGCITLEEMLQYKKQFDL